MAAGTGTDPVQPTAGVTATQQDPPDAGEDRGTTEESPPQSPGGGLARGDSGSEVADPYGSDSSDNDSAIDPTVWNPIIPTSSRRVPVGNNAARREGTRSRQVMNTPTTKRPTLAQIDHRMFALRQLLGEPVGITDQELYLALVASGWDLGTSLRRINDILNQARHRHQTNAPGRPAAEQQRDRLIGADSLHHNRRLGIEFLYTRLVQVVRADQRNQLTTLTLGQLLADHRFDVDETVDAFLERLLHPAELADHQRMERRLRLINPNQLHEDQRLARFMEIAGVDDFYAAQALLQTHGHDLLRTMDHWMRYGLADRPIPSNAEARTLFFRSRRAHDDTEDLWPHPRPLAGPLLNVDVADLRDANQDYGDPPYQARNGWIVRYPRYTAQIGLNIPPRRDIEYVRHGTFMMPRVRSVPIDGHERDRARFDYNDTGHVAYLNNTAAQWYRRTEGTTTKVKGDRYQDDENEWLWWWHNERFWEYVENHPELLNPDGALRYRPQRIRYDTDRLRRDFNLRWHIQAGRQPRKVRSLDAQRRRVLDICNDFCLPYSPPNAKRGRVPPGSPPHGSSTSGSSSARSSPPGSPPPGSSSGSSSVGSSPPRNYPPDSDEESGDSNDPRPPKKKPNLGPKKGGKGGRVARGKGQDTKGKKKARPVDDVVDSDVDEDGDESSAEESAQKSKPRPKRVMQTKQPSKSRKRKRSAEHLEDEENSNAGGDQEESDEEPPPKGSRPNLKGGSLGKRKGRNEEEDESDYDGPASSSTRGQKETGTRRSKRTRGR
jgi:hypothetical protein